MPRSYFSTLCDKIDVELGDGIMKVSILIWKKGGWKARYGFSAKGSLGGRFVAMGSSRAFGRKEF